MNVSISCYALSCWAQFCSVVCMKLNSLFLYLFIAILTKTGTYRQKITQRQYSKQNLHVQVDTKKNVAFLTGSTLGTRGFFLSFLISGSSRCDLFATESEPNIVLFGIAIVWQCLVELVQ